jgi:hypothetical protein
VRCTDRSEQDCGSYRSLHCSFWRPAHWGIGVRIILI